MDFNFAMPGFGSNPLDPNQFLKWKSPALQIGEQVAGMNLYDPQMLASLRTILGPYFAQQTQLLNAASSRAGSQAGSSAGAYAASKNMANPLAFIQNAQKRVREEYAPQYESLATSQLGQLMNAGVQSQQFNAQNMRSLMQLLQNYDQMKTQNWYASQGSDNSDIWGQLGSSLIGAGATIGGALILA